MATTAQALTVDPDQQAILKELAAHELRSPEFLLHDAIEQYLVRRLSSREQGDEEATGAFEQTAAERQHMLAEVDESLRHYDETGLHVTWQEVDEWLGKLQAGEDVPPPQCHV